MQVNLVIHGRAMRLLPESAAPAPTESAEPLLHCKNRGAYTQGMALDPGYAKATAVLEAAQDNPSLSKVVDQMARSGTLHPVAL